MVKDCPNCAELRDALMSAAYYYEPANDVLNSNGGGTALLKRLQSLSDEVEGSHYRIRRIGDLLHQKPDKENHVVTITIPAWAYSEIKHYLQPQL